MKKIFILASLFVAAAFTSCEKSESVAKSETNTILVKAVLPGATRTAVLPGEEGYDVVWTAGDALKLGYYHYNDGGYNNNGQSNITIQLSDDPKIGYISVDAKSPVGEQYVSALYPASAKIGDPSHSGPLSIFFINVPVGQAAGDNAPDPKASLMFSQFTHPGAENSWAGDDYYNCAFDHIMAYCKLNFKNLDGTNISKVKFTVNDEGAEVSGTTFAYNWADKKIISGKKADSSNWHINNTAQNDTDVKNYVEVTCEAAVDAPVWFALIPSYGKKYTDVTVEVTVDGATKTKNFKGVDLEFKAGIVLSLDVDMTGAE